MIFARADLTAPDLRELLAFHLQAAFQNARSAAYDETRLSEPDVDLFTLRDERGALLGMAALKTLDGSLGEVKSVRTHPDHLRKGVAHRLMDGIEAEARRRGMRALLLETHPTPSYAAARALYENRGYAYREPFGDYADTDKSVFMELTL